MGPAAATTASRHFHTCWIAPGRGGLQHSCDTALGESFALLIELNSHTFPWDDPLDEHHPAIVEPTDAGTSNSNGFDYTLREGHLRRLSGSSGCGPTAKARGWQSEEPEATATSVVAVNAPTSPSPENALLITVSGPDHPGITSELMAILHAHGGAVDDVEQVVVRGHLVLSLVIEIGDPDTLRKELLLLAYDRNLQITFETVKATPTERALGAVVTVIAQSISAEALGSIASNIARCGGNIDRIVRLARYPVVAYDLVVLGVPIDQLRAALGALAGPLGVDIALQRDGLGLRAQRLVVLDVDSTLIQNEVIDLLAAEANCEPEVAALTERAMAGELDFEQSLRARVKLLTGLHESALAAAAANVRLTPGARTFIRTLKQMGFKVALVSGGFSYFTELLKEELGLDHAYANELEVLNGVLTGRLVGPVVDRERKAALLREIATLESIDRDQTVAVGDGANDLDMLAEAGLGIAFNAKPMVQHAADTTVNVPYLDAILFVLGVRRAEVEIESDVPSPQHLTLPPES